MGSLIEINDTLKISKERGFPTQLRIEDHNKDSDKSSSFVGQQFNFWNNGERLYHRTPTRVFLVEEMPDGKWLYWGHALIIEQTIKEGKTAGRYSILKIYAPEYQKQVTIEESPQGKNYFSESPTSFLP